MKRNNWNEALLSVCLKSFLKDRTMDSPERANKDGDLYIDYSYEINKLKASLTASNDQAAETNIFYRIKINIESRQWIKNSLLQLASSYTYCVKCRGYDNHRNHKFIWLSYHIIPYQLLSLICQDFLFVIYHTFLIKSLSSLRPTVSECL